MTMTERGVYITLLSLCWLEGSLPSDPLRLARLVGMSEASFAKVWSFPLSECFQLNEEGRLVHKRLDRERDKQKRHRDHQAARGSQRWSSEAWNADVEHRVTRSHRLSEARKRGTHTDAEWEAMRSRYGRCLCCGVLESQLEGGRCVKDHIIPIYLDGSDSITNLQPLCRNCNSRKGPDRTDYRVGLPETPAEWLPNACRDAGVPQASNAFFSSSSSSSTPVTKKQTSSVVRPKPPDPRVKQFLDWFQVEYRTRRNGAEYLVKWAKHGALVKPMLAATSLENLKIYAQILLSDKTDEPWIAETDRGIEVLSARFSWLADRYAQWKNKQGQAS